MEKIGISFEVSIFRITYLVRLEARRRVEEFAKVQKLLWTERLCERHAMSRMLSKST